MIITAVFNYEGEQSFYALTDEQLRNKEQPSYIASRAALQSILSKALKDEKFEDLQYGPFWQRVREAGIEVKEEDVKPHSLPQKVSVSNE